MDIPFEPRAPAEIAQPSSQQLAHIAGMHDPLQPPLSDPSVRGRVPSYPQQAMFILLFTEEDPELVMSALSTLWPDLAREMTTGIGDTLQRHDQVYAQRWQPLKPSTIEWRKKHGWNSTYPYSDRYAYNWQINRWGTLINHPTTDTISASVGPSEATQSHRDWSKTRLSQYGTPPGHGDGKGNTQQKPERPLGMSVDIARRIQQLLNNRLPSALQGVGLAADSAHAVLAPDMLAAERPMFLM